MLTQESRPDHIDLVDIDAPIGIIEIDEVFEVALIGILWWAGHRNGVAALLRSGIHGLLAQLVLQPQIQGATGGGQFHCKGRHGKAADRCQSDAPSL